MAPAFAFAELVLAITLVLAAANSLRKNQRPFGWWIVFCAACLVGFGVGIWFGFSFSYQPSPHLIVYSFPVPGAFHVLETSADGSARCIDFITPAPLLSAIGNAFFFLGLAAAPVWVASVFGKRGGRPSQTAPQLTTRSS